MAGAHFTSGLPARVRRLRRAAKSQLTVMTNAKVICLDGVDGVEAVVIRNAATGRLFAVNAHAFRVVRRLDRP